MDEIKITIENFFYCKLISIILQHAIQVQITDLFSQSGHFLLCQESDNTWTKKVCLQAHSSHCNISFFLLNVYDLDFKGTCTRL